MKPFDLLRPEQRRASKTYLANELRKAIFGWREQGYPEVSPTTKRLLEFWFSEDHIINNEPFNITFSGTIGINGCCQFSQFKTEEQGNNIIIEAWGKLNKNSNICSDVMVYLDNDKLNYLIKENGIYTIKVKLPDDNYLEKQITVE